jgi:hypothetical protein
MDGQVRGKKVRIIHHRVGQCLTFFRTIFPAKQKAIRAGEEKEAFLPRMCPSNTER